MITRLLVGILICLMSATLPTSAQQSLLPEFNYNRRNEKAYVDSLLRVGQIHRQQAERAPRTPHNDTLHLESLRFITLVHKQLRTNSRDSSYFYAQRLYEQATLYGNKLFALHGLLQQEYYLRVARNDYLTALSLNQKAHALCAGLPAEQYPIWQVHMNLGDIYLLTKDYAAALRNHQASLQKLGLYKQTSARNRQLLTAQLTTQIGEIYEAKGQFADAHSQFEAARKIALTSGSQPNVAYANERLGDFWLKRSQSAQAIQTYNQALSIWQSLNDVPGQASVWARLAEVYLQAGQYDRAVRLGEQALVVGRQNNNARIQQMATLALYRAYRANGQPAQALTMYEVHVSIRDSLASRKQIEEMLLLQRDVETRALRAEAKRSHAEQRASIATLNREMERQIQLGAALMGGLLMLLVFSGILYWRNGLIRKQRAQIELLNVGLEDKVRQRTAELEQANEQLRAKNREIEEALLRGQTLERKRVAADLHDNLGGLLSAIRMSLSALKPDNLNKREQQVYKNLLNMTKEAYAEVRHLSHNLQPDELEKEGLSQALNRLFDKLNQTQLVRFVVEMDELPRLDKGVEFNLYSICLELCTNILKHSGATEATIQFRRLAGELNMVVRDNGRGLSNNASATVEADASMMAGMGLRNIRARTEAMKGRLEIYSGHNEGTTFFFILPLTATFAEQSQEVDS